jgi:hypothetical protein
MASTMADSHVARALILDPPCAEHKAVDLARVAARSV